MRALAAALAAAALLTPAAALAQPVSDASGPDTYLHFHLGAVLPQSSALDRLDTGYGFGGTFGARFNPNVSVEGALAYDRSEGRSSATIVTYQDLPFTVSMRLRVPLQGLELSGFAGGGLHSPRLTTRIAGVSTTQRATVFGYHLGAAIAAELWPTTLVGAEARWTFLDPRLDGVRTRLDTLRLAVTLQYRF
jgi:opacity protein-like surface antigen